MNTFILLKKISRFYWLHSVFLGYSCSCKKEVGKGEKGSMEEQEEEEERNIKKKKLFNKSRKSLCPVYPDHSVFLKII